MIQFTPDPCGNKPVYSWWGDWSKTYEGLRNSFLDCGVLLYPTTFFRRGML